MVNLPPFGLRIECLLAGTTHTTASNLFVINVFVYDEKTLSGEKPSRDLED
jgi:hypothetical protein